MNKLAIFVLLASAFLTTSSFAQVDIQIGPRVGIDVAGDIEEPFVGADARIRLPALPVILNPTFDYYFAEGDLTIWQLAGHALYEFGIDNQVFTPYAGAGISITRVSVDVDTPFGGFGGSSSEVGLNGVAGATFSAGPLNLFGQAQLTFSDLDIVALAAGLLFDLGG